MTNEKNSFYGGVFLLSGVVTAMQILQSRIFSVTTWYHLSFIVISIAMFGLTLGALNVWRGNEQEQRTNLMPAAAKASLMCGICLMLALLVQLNVPLVFDTFKWTLVVLPVVGIVTGLPYYWAGVALSLCLTRTSLPVGRVYGIDLLGAAAGCLGALALMKIVDTPSGVALLAAMAAASALLFAAPAPTAAIVRVARLFGTVIFMIAAVNAAIPRHFFYPIWVKDKMMPRRVFEFDEWNPISRVTVTHPVISLTPFLWGPSPRLPHYPPSSLKKLVIDGDAGTLLTKFDGKSWNRLGYLDYDVTNLAYHLPGLKRAAIIGVGGGRDLLSAKYFHVPEVVAMDVNPI